MVNGIQFDTIEKEMEVRTPGWKTQKTRQTEVKFKSHDYQ